jgi:threonine dehydrogenase-like Zn-dependent dehydrogenase
MMRALAIDAPGTARVVERPRPMAGAGEALVRVRRAGLCGTDLSTFLGKNPLVSYPRVIGHEIAGTIEALGDGVSGWRAGAAVALSPYKNCGACAACRHERPNACRNNQTLGVQREGALAEFAVVSTDRLFTSAALSLDHLALVEPFCIGMHAVRRARVVADDTVLVMGCGGVGAGAVAAAAVRGAHVVAMDVDPTKLAQASALGARETVISTDADAAERIRALSRGEGPDVVIEAVGKPATYRLALDLVAACGRIVYIGWVKGDISLEARQIVAKEVDILGSRNATDEFADVIALFESGRVDPLALVTNRVALDDVPAMLARWAERPDSVGKILVEI